VTRYFRNLRLSYVHINNNLSFNAVYYKTMIRIDNKASICTKDHMSPTTENFSLILITVYNFNGKSVLELWRLDQRLNTLKDPAENLQQIPGLRTISSKNTLLLSVKSTQTQHMNSTHSFIFRYMFRPHILTTFR